jgi:hypothetical protein
MAHRHKTKNSQIYGYSGPIVGAREERRAHGGVRIVDYCACGATRACNSTGNFLEQGPWRTPDAIEVRS